MTSQLSDKYAYFKRFQNSKEFQNSQYFKIQKKETAKLENGKSVRSSHDS